MTYEIACSKGLPAEQAELVKGFLTYTASDAGQPALDELGYAPLPPELADQGRSRGRPRLSAA